MVQTSDDLKPGDFYEDCGFHPCLCIKVDEDEVSGISLIDGTTGRCCSIRNCGIQRLTTEEAVDWKFYGPADVEDRELVEESLRWWERHSQDTLRCYRPRRQVS